MRGIAADEKSGPAVRDALDALHPDARVDGPENEVGRGLIYMPPE